MTKGTGKAESPRYSAPYPREPPGNSREDVRRNTILDISRQKTFDGDYVFVKFPIIPMPPFFMGKVLGLMFELVTAINHSAADFNGYHTPVDFDGNFHLAFSFRSDFVV